MIIPIINKKGKYFEIIFDVNEIPKFKSLDYSWHTTYNLKTDSYYAHTTVYLGVVNEKPKYKTYYMHKLILDCDRNKNEYIHHKNHNTLDNRKCNLEVLTNELNSKHRKDRNKNNKTGYRNVCLIDGKYVVQLQVKGKNTRLGAFDDIMEAAKYAREMRELHYGEYAGNG